MENIHFASKFAFMKTHSQITLFKENGFGTSKKPPNSAKAYGGSEYKRVANMACICDCISLTAVVCMYTNVLLYNAQQIK